MKILVGLILLDSIMLGTIIVLERAGQDEEDPPELELELELELVIAAVAAGAPVVPAAHVDLVMELLFNVTAPFLARSLPLTVELPLSVIDVKASTFPLSWVVVPRVAEKPTCQ